MSDDDSKRPPRPEVDPQAAEHGAAEHDAAEHEAEVTRSDAPASGPRRPPLDTEVERLLSRSGPPSFFPDDSEETLRKNLEALRPSHRPPDEAQSGVTRAPRPPSEVPPHEISRIVPLADDQTENQAHDQARDEARDDAGKPTHEINHQTDPPADASPSGLLTTVLTRSQADEGARAARSALRPRSQPQDRRAPRSTPSARARAQRLEQLAERQPDAKRRARLLAAAAELHQSVGNAARASALWAVCHELHPRDPQVLRELRKDALANHRHEQAAQLLQAERELLQSPHERALAGSLLAELQLYALDQPEQAEASAAQAFAEYPGGLAAGLLLAEARLRRGRAYDAAEALRRTAEMWPDERARAALLIDAGRLLRSAGELAQALGLFERAARADRRAAEASIEAYRCARELVSPPSAQAALDRLLSAVADERLASQARRLHARFRAEAGDLTGALAELHDDESLPSQHARARLGEQLGDAGEQGRALLSCAERSAGALRACYLVDLAALLTHNGSVEQAQRALDAAEQAAPGLPAIAALRSALSRGASDSSQLARLSERAPPEGALEFLGRVAARGEPFAEECEMLERARCRGVDEATRQALWLDAEAERGDAQRVAARLRARCEHGAPHERFAYWLALADLAGRDEALDHQRPQWLEEAERAAPHSPLPLLARLRDELDEGALGELWLQLSARTHDEFAAFAACCAAAHLERSGGAREALERALAARPGYPPACWALEPRLRGAGEWEELSRIERALAREARDAKERAARLVRAARALPAGDRDAVALMAQAVEVWPDDARLCELAARYGDRTALLPLAASYEADGAHAAPAAARAAKLMAADLYLQAGAPSRAADLYRGLQQASEGDDPLARLRLPRALRDAGRTAAADGAAASPHAQLRQRQREAMATGDGEALAQAAGELARLTRDPRQAWAHLRVALRRSMAHRGGMLDACRESFAELQPSADGLLWAIQREEQGRREGDAQLTFQGMAFLCETFEDADERASYAAAAARQLERLSDERARAFLERQLVPQCQNSLAVEELARLSVAVGQARRAATLYGDAAALCEEDARAVRLYYRAAELWETTAGDTRRARHAFEQAADRQLDYRDTFARLHALLRAEGDDDALLSLIDRRLAAANEGEAPRSALSELYAERARLLLERGDSARARASLSDALANDPQRLETLQGLARLALSDGEYREAAEALIRLARSAREPAVLREAFLQLGEIYERHLPDPRRAEIAYTRVLSLAPDHRHALERLVAIFGEQAQYEKALRALTRLLELCRDENDADRYHVQQAELLSLLGEDRRVEQLLEARRRVRPGSRRLIDALTQHYTAQGDRSALLVHLDRAVHGFRDAVATSPDDAEAWAGLADTLRRRGRSAHAESVLSIARSLQVRGLPEPADARPPRAVRLPPEHASFLPAELNDSARALLQALEPYADMLLPFDAEACRIGPLTSPLGIDLETLQRRAGARFEVRAMEHEACLVIGKRPLTLAIGRGLLERLDARAVRFLLLHAAATAQGGLWLAARCQPDALRALCGALCALAGAPPGRADSAQLSARLAAVRSQLPPEAVERLSRRAIDALLRDGLDAGSLPRLAAQAGARLALAAERRVPPALRALVATASPAAKRAAEIGRAELTGQALLAAAGATEQARELLRFALSDTFLATLQSTEAG